MHQAPTQLITERLILRRPSLADAAAIYEFGRDSEVARYMDWPRHKDIQDSIEALESFAAEWESGSEFCWAITTKTENTAMGTIACRIESPRADFGYVLNRRYWGQGFATEAVRAVMSWVMSLPEIDRIWATCDTENLASARVLEKAGLQREGTLPRSTIRPNLSSTPRDTFIFAKVRDPV
ncbi:MULTISPECIES: GNAT family N-acetyltransferase [Cyanophyceae]|uniref:GNAT family N-acetyltransferase n=1 Tax=Cyanophyceae TaxID=3028117 RepID=UPI00168839D2|nr:MULTISPECIES: GNAT family N-acetyltransferase [Cyanophyceae]MBD1914898.1 GNAT family N-acetyltransferase [Phormidium sp. FACHB-77]MBD2028576.1 GNAT family N-acetyltransferase [Phormidium sp. FACHB-322]MBD2051780.1 GNAT family N-acetyltransferase [Leptolyngbya sp. FACHB-60]